MLLSYWAGSGQPWSDIVTSSTWAAENGWCGLWVADHFMSQPQGGFGPAGASHPPEMEPVLEAWTMQAALAAIVPNVRVGAMVTGITYRHPAIVANMAATLDHISNGRAVLGIGAGWQENEHARYGLDLGTPRERSDRLEEACEVVTSLLRNDRTTFSGSYYELDGAPCEPKPVQEQMPLLVAGGGELRTIPTAARWADEYNVWGGPEVLEQKVGVLRTACEAIDRDASDIRVSACALVHICESEKESADLAELLGNRAGMVGTVDQLRARVDSYTAAGVDELIIPDFNLAPADRPALLSRLQTEVLGW